MTYLNQTATFHAMPKPGETNAYGLVVSEKRVPGFNLIKETLPVICMHGGSMWLCKSCADEIICDVTNEEGHTFRRVSDSEYRARLRT